MDEILASIRRIIADDQDAPKPATATVAPAPSEPEADEFDLADIASEPAAAAPVPPEPAPPTLDEPALEVDVPDLSFAEPEPMAAPSPSPPAAAMPDPGEEPRRPPQPSTVEPDVLISTAATASVGQAFQMLSHTILSQNARTLEDLVQEMLKPMLKAWLDDNLPPLVERLVRNEIERVARGRS
ncbi:MAG: DUF2497 domain-containing protein [Methylobacteriaceae bacterium]|nr:DUF2497 domain-containing protein [Methylobacteriaceae bacterium]